MKNSKTSLIVLLLLLTSIDGFSQLDGNKTPNENLIANENSKSGNYKDIFNSLFQLAAKGLANDEKTIEFKSTLFALKSKANPELLKGYNYANERFSRNLQFNIKVDLDEAFKYKGFTGGITIAIVNGRDRQLAVFSKTVYGKEYEKFSAEIDKITQEILDNNGNPLQESEITKVENALDSIKSGLSFENNKNKYYKILPINLNSISALIPHCGKMAYKNTSNI